MFTIKSRTYLNDNHTYRKKKRMKFFKRFDKLHRAHHNESNYDIRLIVLRHAERVDLFLGENWYEQVFGGLPSAPTENYAHPVLPSRLPYRLNTLLYVFDPPITRLGEQNSIAKGQEFARLGAHVDHCYSSPACRSVLTASAILRGMRSNTPIHIEPYLFEPMSWNAPLQMLGTTSPFMSTGDWAQAGYNVDRRYHRLGDHLNPVETEHDYYMRSQLFLQSIERRHGGSGAASMGRGFPQGRRSTILVVGHAATPLIYSNIALRQPFNAEVFGQQCASIPFLHSFVLERNAANRMWYSRSIMPFV